MATSPSILTFPGSSPSRDTPNSHPYAIKTSSSAVLTRSNSAGHRYNTNHHYLPISPSKSPIGTKQSRYVPSNKHSRSLPSAIGDPAMTPPPVPMPPSSALPARLANQGQTNGDLGAFSDGEGIPPTPPLTWRVKRSETLPSMFPNRSDTEIGVQDLPNNPKAWTPTQLSVYLSSALRMKGGAKLPVPVVRDIGLLVMKEHLSGRAFLRMKKEDYDALGINQLWKDALLDASRSLRQNLVQGRIMGFGSGSPQSSKSTEELLLVPEEDDTGSGALPAYNSLDLTHHRAPSTPPRQWEEDKKRMSKTSFRAGRVRGMVETYERSFSESSASGSDCDEREDVVAILDGGQLVCEPEDEGGFASGEETSTSEDGGNTTMVSVDSGTGEGVGASSSKAHAQSDLAMNGTNVAPSPPSVKELLNEHKGGKPQGDRYHSWGAKAWEDEIDNPTGVHATAKRVPLDNTISQKHKPRELDMSSPTSGNASKGLTELFSQLTIDETHPPKATKDAGVNVKKESKDTTRAPGPAVYELLKDFQKRLEIVEKRIDEMEREEEEKTRIHEQAQNEVAQRQDENAIVKQDVLQDGVDVGPAVYLPHPSDTLHDVAQDNAGEDGAEQDDVEPEKEQWVTRNYLAADPSISELPRYMLLVSLGVVALTTRVVLKRVIGDRRGT